MTMSAFVFLILITSYIINTNSVCNSPDSTTCDSNTAASYCTAQTSKFQYPDPATGFATYAVVTDNNYTCNSQSFCEWAQMWGNDCIRINIANKLFPSAFYNNNTKQCSIINMPISINATMSCCQNDMNCTAIFNGIDEETTSIYSTANCINNNNLESIIDSLLDCYITDDFVSYLKCNITDYNGTCPFYLFNTFQTYAKCSCNVLSSISDSYLYFAEITNMIENIIKPFRPSNANDNCPNWIYSCNSNGDALLLVHEILCPLTATNMTDLETLSNQIKQGIGIENDQQITIYNEYKMLRVLMYSESEANDVMNYLQSQAISGLDIGDNCTVNKVIWNVNETYADYLEATKEPTKGPTVSPITTKPTLSPITTEPTVSPLTVKPTESPVTAQPTDAPEPQTNDVYDEWIHIVIQLILMVFALY